MSNPADFIPDPVLQAVHNGTPFAHTQYDKMGPGRKFYDVVILSASFDLVEGIVPLSHRQKPPVLADEAWDLDRPMTSSLKHAQVNVLYKPGCDIYMTGTAHSFQAKARSSWSAGIRVRRGQEVLMRKALRLTGPRAYEHKPWTGWKLYPAQATKTVELRYELAYGGSWIDPKEKDPDLALQLYEHNPSGCGFFGDSHDRKKLYLGPQIEHLNEAILQGGQKLATPLPAGFAPIQRFWMPRVQLQGTYDDAWMQQYQNNPIPDFPSDFDLRYFQYAPADQIIADHLRGDEILDIAGVFEESKSISAQLPGWGIQAWALTSQGSMANRFAKLDTVHIDLDERQVHLTWRITLNQTAGATTLILEHTKLAAEDEQETPEMLEQTAPIPPPLQEQAIHLYRKAA